MSRVAHAVLPPAPPAAAGAISALYRGQPVLAAFGLLMWLLMLPAALGLLLDPRTLNESLVWLKPLKFFASLGLFALTSAWVLGHVAEPARHGRAARFVVVVIVAMSTFEAVYIAWQAGHGEASHFNTGDRFHAVMYQLMGVGAVMLTATSGLLAWLVARHAAPGLHPAFRLSIVLGLLLTLALGTATGGFMSAQPGHFAGTLLPTATLPLFGWSMTGGDYRVAHFFGMHVQQALPLAGALIVRLRMPAPRLAVWAFAAGWCVLVAVTLLQARAGQPFFSA